MHKFLILDRDGVINVDYGYVGTYQRFEFQPYIKQILRTATYNNFEAVIATNQSGIARGFYTINDFKTLMEEMNKELKNDGLPYLKYWFCPHHKDGILPQYTFECTCRKPQTGMIQSIDKYKKIDKKRSILVGDNNSDIDAGRDFGIENTYLVEHSSTGRLTHKSFSNITDLIERLSCYE